MNRVNLLVNTYFYEKNEEGIATLKSLISDADTARLTIFTQGAKGQFGREDGVLRIAEPFNLIEGNLEIRQNMGEIGRVDIRYRPSISSKTWPRISLPSDPELLMKVASRAHAPKDADEFQLLLSLKSFETASLREKRGSTAVFEALYYSIPLSDSVEETILNLFRTTFRKLLEFEIWGHASLIPFRLLSIAEEWEAAAGMILWANLTILEGVHHQYLFVSRKVPLPKLSVPYKLLCQAELDVYRLAY